jgi:hypothetical protein
MTHDFSYDFETSWKSGGSASTNKSYNRVVLYDQNYRAYQIYEKNDAAFIDWVSQNWELDYKPRDIINNEAAWDYLDRVGIQIIEH